MSDDFNYDNFISNPVTEEELINDPSFIENAWTWYNSYEAKSRAVKNRQAKKFMVEEQQDPESAGWAEMHERRTRQLTSDEEVAKWAVQQASSFNWNFSKMVVDYNRVRQEPVGTIKAVLGVIDAYDNIETDTKTVARGTVNMMSDPLTLLGFTAITGNAIKNSSKGVLKGYLKNVVTKKLSNPLVVNSASGAAYSGATGHVMEDLDSTAEQRNYNAATPMVYAGVGAGFSAGATLAPKAIGNAFDKVVGLAQTFKGYRGGGEGGATFTDSKAVAKNYGEVSEKEVKSLNPLVLNDETMTLDDIADAAGFDEMEEAILKKIAEKNNTQAVTPEQQLENSMDAAAERINASIQNNIANDKKRVSGASLEVSALLREAEMQELLERKGIDLVAYPERTSIVNKGDGVLEAEYDSPDSSLSRDNVFMTYRQIGGPVPKVEDGKKVN